MAIIAIAIDFAKNVFAVHGVDAASKAVLVKPRQRTRLQVRKQLAAWLGLVPSQYSSGGKQRLGRITKAGDGYLRMLLILGARAVVANAKKKDEPLSRWVADLAERRGYWKAVVAVAAKNARMAWAMLSKGEAFRPLT